MTPTLDLAPEHLAIVREILAQCVPECTAWAFGSRTTGRAVKYSDLDLAIQCPSALTLARSAELGDAFSESLLPMMVDVVDWNAISEEFRQAITDDRIQVFPG